MNNRVVVLGSFAAFATSSPRRSCLPAVRPLIGDDYHIVVGGKGSGQAVVAQKLGGDVFLLERLVTMRTAARKADVCRPRHPHGLCLPR